MSQKSSAEPEQETAFRPGYEGFLAFAAAVDLRLEPFQRRIARAVLGEQREALVLVSRGQGKSRLMGTLAVHHLVTEPRASVFLAASSREQAAVCFAYAKDVAEHPALHSSLLVRYLELRAPDGGRLRVLASDAPKLHGLTPSFAVVDELHAHKDGEVYIALRTAMLKRPGARMVTISTAGQGADTPLAALRARALAQPDVTRTGALTEASGPGLAFLEWAVPADADVDDPAVTKQANPASWITVDGLRDQRAALPDLAFRRYHAGQWTSRDGQWLPAGAWNACVGEPDFTDGERIWVGVDVGAGDAATAVVWVNEALHVGAAIFSGEAGILEAIAEVRALAARYRVVEIIYDPWRFGQAALELERERLTLVAFAQSDARMIPASQDLHRAIIDKRLVLPDDRTLALHASNAVARHSRRGWRLDAPSRRENIDALVALAMAVQRATGPRAPAARLLGFI